MADRHTRKRCQQEQWPRLLYPQDDKHAGAIAGFYLRVGDRMFHIEVGQDDNGDMALRVFRHTVGGAMPRNTAALLINGLREAAEGGSVPYHIALEMQDVIRATAENTIAKSKMEVGLDMNTNIVETLPWIDYQEVFQKIEERGIAEGEARGEARGKAERDREIALNAFGRVKMGCEPKPMVDTLVALGISHDAIKGAARESGVDITNLYLSRSEQ